jgi:hypothetical protein
MPEKFVVRHISQVTPLCCVPTGAGEGLKFSPGVVNVVGAKVDVVDGVDSEGKGVDGAEPREGKVNAGVDGAAGVVPGKENAGALGEEIVEAEVNDGEG